MPKHNTTAAGITGLAALSLLGGAADAAPPRLAPDQSLVLREWVVLGPIAAPSRLDDRKDYLAALGGEPKAALKDGAPVSLTDGTGKAVTLTARRVETDAAGVLDFLALFSTSDENLVAYAWAEFDSPEAGPAGALLGSDDWAFLWINGDLVFSRSGPGGRGLVPRQDRVPVTLKKGRNTVLLKVDQANGAWGATLEIAPKAEMDRLAAREAEMRRVRSYQNLEIRPVEEWRRIFPPGPFPALAWSDPALAASAWGDKPLRVRWFDADLNEVTTAAKPGRYAAYIEADGPDGQVARRAATFFCRQDPPPTTTDPPAVPFDGFPFGDVDPSAWARLKPAFSRLAGQELGRLLYTTEAGPIWLAGLSEPRPGSGALTQMEWPDMAHQDHHLALKLKVLGTAGKFGTLAPPRKKAGAPAPVLRPGTPAEAGLKADAPERIRAACKAWNDATGIPFTALVARNGVIAFHVAFGTTAGKPAAVTDQYQIASVTKTHTGLMFAQFLDQGLISLDDPVGKYLPGFATEGPQALTLRHCLTNTSGLEGHGEFGGMMNPWLDNVLANGMGPLEPGKSYLYNGMGYDLAGKVMEVVAGKSIFRLLHENFFTPLGQDNPTMVDLAYGISCSAADLGRVGQMMLNKGAYGDVEFFSVKTFDEKVRPRPLKEFYPNIANERDLAYNMGMHTPGPSDPENAFLGTDVLRHGSATGAVLRVGYTDGLVITMSRPDPGPDYDRHLLSFIKAVGESLAR